MQIQIAAVQLPVSYRHYLVLADHNRAQLLHIYFQKQIMQWIYQNYYSYLSSYLFDSRLNRYTHKNILAFGDLIHRIHPLAGQGFNMTIRDIKIMSKIVNDKISIGLPIDASVAEDFQASTKHLNYLYGNAIDGIYEFFNFDNKINNSISKPVFKILNKNSVFKKYVNILSDKGLNL